MAQTIIRLINKWTGIFTAPDYCCNKGNIDSYYCGRGLSGFALGIPGDPHLRVVGSVTKPIIRVEIITLFIFNCLFDISS